MKKLISKKSKAASELGKLGGRAKFKKWGKEHMSKIGKKGAKARWLKENKNK